jgi:hypothetical protein
MAATSNHYGDVFMWVHKVIDSCDQYNQILAAHKLVDNFCNMEYLSLEPIQKSDLNRDLISAVHNKQGELLDIQYGI